MTDKTIDLDEHRGMAAQKATELRRLLAEVAANEKALRLRQDELEAHLLAAPAANWHEAAEKARYLLNLFATTLAAEDPRRQKLIAAVLADFERLSAILDDLAVLAMVSMQVGEKALREQQRKPAMKKLVPDTIFNEREQPRLSVLQNWVLDNSVSEIVMTERQFWKFVTVQPLAEKPWPTYMGRPIRVPDMSGSHSEKSRSIRCAGRSRHMNG